MRIIPLRSLRMPNDHALSTSRPGVRIVMRSAPVITTLFGITCGVIASGNGVWWLAPVLIVSAMLAALAQQTLP